MSVVIICHDIRSTYNIGSILRTADGFGVSEVVACGLTPYTIRDDRPPHVIIRHKREISKTALGAEKTVSMHYFSSIIDAINFYRQSGFQILAIEQSENSINIRDFIPHDRSIAIIFGSETKGLPNNILKASDQVLEIPMAGAKESFNVSVSCGIVLFQLSKNLSIFTP